MQQFLLKLREESAKWVKNSLISADQQKQILSLYGEKLQAFEKAESSHKIVGVISVLGAILLGVGIILFIASNWQEIPKYLKMAILIAATFGVFGSGYYLKYIKNSLPKTGSALIFLSSLMFGAALFLIAQIYHINANAHGLILVWFMGILPLAYIFRSTLNLTSAILIFLLWLGFYLVEVHDVGIQIFNVYFIVGLALYALGSIHAQFESTQKLSQPLKIFGILGTTVITYLFTFGGIIDEIQDEIPETSDLLFHAPFTVIGIVTLFLALIAIAIKKDDTLKTYYYENVSLISLAAVSFLFEFFPYGFQEISYRLNVPIFYPVLFNLLLLAIIIGLIVSGYRNKQTALVHFGLFFFALDVISRYFDFFYELLPRSLFFIIGGLILLFGGIAIEKQRKKLIHKILGNL